MGNGTLGLAVVVGFAVWAHGAAAAMDAGTGEKAKGAAALPAGKPQLWQQHCQAEVDKLCKDAMKTGTVPECLASHETELSETCQRSFLYKYKVAQLCKEDIEKICKPKMATGMSVGQCFRENEKNLSDRCREAISKASKQWKAEKKAESVEDQVGGKPAAKTPADPAATAAKPAKPKRSARSAKQGAAGRSE